MTTAINIDRHIGARLKMRRQELDISAIALGDKIGASEAQMSRYESGGTPIKPALMGKLAKILKVDITYFLEGL